MNAIDERVLSLLTNRGPIFSELAGAALVFGLCVFFNLGQAIAHKKFPLVTVVISFIGLLVISFLARSDFVAESQIIVAKNNFEFVSHPALPVADERSGSIVAKNYYVSQGVIINYAGDDGVKRVFSPSPADIMQRDEYSKIEGAFELLSLIAKKDKYKTIILALISLILGFTAGLYSRRSAKA